MKPRPLIVLIATCLFLVATAGCQSKTEGPPDAPTAPKNELSFPPSLAWAGQPADSRPSCEILGWSSTTDGTQHICDTELNGLPGDEHGVLVTDEDGRMLFVAMQGTHTAAQAEVEQKLLEHVGAEISSNGLKPVEGQPTHLTRHCKELRCIDVKVDDSTWRVAFIDDHSVFDAQFGGR